MMTPEDYMRIRDIQWKKIETANKVIDKAWDEANEYPMPENMRPANAGDIKLNAIIWHERPKEHGGPFWHTVDEVLKPDDDFKAYMCDGSRYGLDGAFVRDESKANRFICPKCNGTGGVIEKRHGIKAEYKCDLCQEHGRVQMAVTINATSRPHAPYDRPLTGPEALKVIKGVRVYGPDGCVDEEGSFETTLEYIQAGLISITLFDSKIKLIPLKGDGDA